MQVEADPQGVLGGWIHANPSNASIAPGEVAAVQLLYNISQQGFQGTYAADVLITTNARPVAKVPSPLHRGPQACCRLVMGYRGHDLTLGPRDPS